MLPPTIADLCAFPGCVAYAGAGTPLCSVHRTQVDGHSCARCKGSGELPGPPRVLCPDCGGVGLADYTRRAPRRVKVPVEDRWLIQATKDES
jgi:hypothetical protein